MYRSIVAFVTAVAVSACSFITVRGAPDARTMATVPAGHVIPCTTSTWAPGVDILLVGTGLLVVGAASEEPDDGEYVAGGIASAVLAVVSAGYGFAKTSECRFVRRRRGEEASGGNDWLFVLAVALTIGGAALARSGGGGNQDQCRPGDRRTAMCADGWVSCSRTRSGTCSHHGGVAYWY